MTRILILKTGSTFEATRRRFGDFDGWFLDALAEAEAEFEVLDITREAPPPLADYDGMIVTGSPAGVYEKPPWLGKLDRLLIEAAERQSPPSLCVCFGAQALAVALGGEVAPSPLGWEIGTIRVRRTEAGRRDPLLGPLPPAGGDELAFQSTHRDRIESLPHGAEVLAENGMSAYQAFRIGERVWGTQFHPEATPEIIEDLIRARTDVLGEGHPSPEERRRTLLDGLAPTPAGPQLLARFVEMTAGPASHGSAAPRRR